MQREFELCAETLQACEAAELGGADRIELCAALSEGGISPSRGFLKAALSTVKTPVHVLILPRGGDFVFTKNEFRAMCDALYGIHNAQHRVRLRKLPMYLGNQSIAHWLHLLHDGTGEAK